VIQLLRVSFTRLAAAMISCLLISSTSPSQQRSARCERACKGLGLQVGASMTRLMSCKIFKQSCKVQVQVRDFIREIKQRADLA
jgi:Fe-S oxidoreductase